MPTADDLRATLVRLDGRGYPAYKDIRGRWELPDFHLSVDHVQGDPFAAPSRVSAHLPPETAGLDPWLLGNEARRLGVAAWLAAAFSRGAEGRHAEGSGKSGDVRMASPGQLVLPQTAVRVRPDGAVEARFTVGLPARGRRILGREAAELLTRRVPELVRAHLAREAHDPADLRRAAAVNEDADALREQLAPSGLVAFVADGAVLPRRSGVDDRPLMNGTVPFESPPSLRVTLEAPNGGAVVGMGIHLGVTLVVGGGFHGKSTLLRALEAGVWNHRPGDGRERVVTVDGAVKIRAEDGRAVTGVDISPFIDRLPGRDDTRSFTTRNASGSTSQAAGLVEALDAGATALLMDEDTCATNFLIRDRRMQALVPSELEPITPLVDRIRELHRDAGVSAVLVLGGSGDYLDVADTVIGMDAFHPRDLTERARQVAVEHPTGRTPETGGHPLDRFPPRRLAPGALPSGRKGRGGRGDRGLRVRTLDGRTLKVGEERLELAAVEQLLLPTQLNTVAAVLERMDRDGGWAGEPLREVARRLAGTTAEELDGVDPRRPGDLAAVRAFEIAAALNRLRSLVVIA
ncbi:MAG TPA: ABC-ATPase domain-containing protein [Longimicrobiales bacterium]|nr:ABC-ATPase domain-containing protein [Longimicrobiales bacterium]